MPKGDYMTEQGLIHFTENASKQLQLIKEQATNDGPKNIRIEVTKGGCSGMSYKMEFSNPSPDDLKLDLGFINVYVDRESSAYIQGMTIDYKISLNSKGFEFHNPNASKTCGCGESFDV